MKCTPTFPDIDNVQVWVEERRILWGGLGADNWRSHAYAGGLEAIPEFLPPSFGVVDATEHEVNLHALIREVSGEKRQRAILQLPYADTPPAAGEQGCTVLRTISIQLTYKSNG